MLNINLYIICDFLFIFSYLKRLKKGVFSRYGQNQNERSFLRRFGTQMLKNVDFHISIFWTHSKTVGVLVFWSRKYSRKRVFDRVPRFTQYPTQYILARQASYYYAGKPIKGISPSHKLWCKPMEKLFRLNSLRCTEPILNVHFYREGKIYQLIHKSFLTTCGWCRWHNFKSWGAEN